MIGVEDYWRIVDMLGNQGAEDIAWAERIKPPTDPDDMALEIVFVICNSGMKHTIARDIYKRCCKVLTAGGTVRGQVLGRSGKANAIDSVWLHRLANFRRWTEIEGDAARLAFLADLPWIGNITKYHLAKNFGMQVAKPDVHLQRLADIDGTTPQRLCERLSTICGHKVATVDTVLWRACAVGVVDSRTGLLRQTAGAAEA